MARVVEAANTGVMVAVEVTEVVEVMELVVAMGEMEVTAVAVATGGMAAALAGARVVVVPCKLIHVLFSSIFC